MIGGMRMEKQTGGANYGKGKPKKKLRIITEFHKLKSLREKGGDKLLHNHSSILEKTSTMPPKLVKGSNILSNQVLEQVLNECLLPHQRTEQNSIHQSEQLSGKLKVTKELTSKEGHCDHEPGDTTEASSMLKEKAKCVFDGMDDNDTPCLIRRSMERLMHEQNEVQNMPSQEEQGNVTQPFNSGYFGIKGKAVKEISGDFDSSGYLNSHVMGINCENRLFSAQAHLIMQELCWKCGEGGQVLNCNCNGCLVAIHESCLGPLENVSNFICPLCSYEKISVVYKKAKGNLNEAHKVLLTFVEDSEVYKKNKGPRAIEIRSTHLDLPSVSHDRVEESFRKTTNQKIQLNDGDDIIHHDFSFCTETLNAPSNLDFDDMNMRGKSNAGEDHNCFEEEEMDTSLYKNNVFNGSKEGEFCDVQLHSKLLKFQDQEEVIHGHNIQQKKLSPQIDDGLLLSENITPFHDHLVVEGMTNKRQSEMHKDHEHESDKELEHFEPVKSHEKAENSKFSHEMDTPHLKNHVPRKKRKGEFCANKHNENVLPKKDKKCKSRRKQNSDSELASYLRRKPLKWTNEEVEMLENAVEKIPANGDGSFAWTKIFDYGRHVFNRTRTPIDLKDKWRNILISRASKES